MASEKASLPLPSTSPKRSATRMRSPRALATLAAFLACPLGLMLLLSHCGFFGRVTVAPSHRTMQNTPSELEEVKGLLKGPSSDDAPHLQMQFCKAENLRRCKAYPYNGGCTKIDDFKVLSMAEPRYFSGKFNGCTVYRKHVVDCAENANDPDSFKKLDDFILNWDVEGEWPEYAFSGHVPRVEPRWRWDIGSFKCS